MNQQVHPSYGVKLSIKIACLLLSFTVLLNGTGFAAMLNCDDTCCHFVPPPSAPASHMGCHEDDMDASPSTPTVQLMALPPNPLPQNLVQCGENTAASMLTLKRELSGELIVSTVAQHVSSSPRPGSEREPVLRLLISTSSSRITAPLRI